MKIAEMTWMELDEQVVRDDRVILPLGSVEQHAFLSLATDAILAERVAAEAARPLHIPVYPALPYGVTPYFMAYPGTVTLQPSTYARVVTEVLDSFVETGFRRITLVNGHGGNEVVGDALEAWSSGHPEVRVLLYSWWKAPATRARTRETDPVAGHASWMESFPWTRVAGATPHPERKPEVRLDDRAELTPGQLRKRLGDGSFGGLYRRSDEEMEALWRVAVEELRELLEGGWDLPAPTG